MKKKLLVVLSLICIFLFCVSTADAATAPNEKSTPTVSYSDVKTYNASYYSSVSGKSGDDLLEGLATLSKSKHRTYTSYDDLWGAACYADASGSSTSQIVDFYTQKSMSNAYDTSKWNREHVWCQSHTNSLFGTTGAGADIHHIRPTTKSINSSRNNSLYGEVSHSKAKYFSFANNKVSTSTSDALYGYLDSSLHDNGVFEPIDSAKGDVARILMYVYMHYSKEVSANSSHSYAGGLYITNIVYTSANTSDAAFDLLCKWNESDPVTTAEMNRNNYCASVTGLRNPFIDHPEFATMIWDDSYTGGGAGSDDSSSGSNEVAVDYPALLSEYYNNGVYTKKSNIYLNGTSTSEIQQYFHGDVAKDRTTYYNGEYLLMGDIDGNFNTINSGYRTSGSNVAHFTYQNGSVVDDYTVEGTTLHSMFVTMKKMKASSYLDSSWTDGIHEVTGNSDKYLSDFLAFAAPCLTDLVFTSNYLTSSGMKLEITEETNSIGDHLTLRIYVSSLDSGMVASDLILSEARIYKGNSVFNDSNSSSTPTVPESGGSSSGSGSGSGSGSDSGSSDSGSGSGGTVITPTKQTYSYTFTKKVFSGETATALGDRNWKATGTDGIYYGYTSAKGHQFGSASNPATTLNLTVTTDFTNISSIYITTCGASGTEAKLKICIGSTVYGERTLTDTSTTYRVTPGGATGRVSFKYTQSTKEGVAKAIYIKEIRVYYTSGVTGVYSMDNLDLQRTPVKQFAAKTNTLLPEITERNIDVFTKYNPTNNFVILDNKKYY